MTRHATAVCLLGAVGVALAACATPVTGNPYPPVPPLPTEAMGKPPVTTTPLMWRPGYWDWTGGGYTWVPGTFVPSAGHGNMWMPGYWARGADGTWVWQPAHWM